MNRRIFGVSALSALSAFHPAVHAATQFLPFDQPLPTGPWGKLVAHWIRICPPIDFVSELRTIPGQDSWRFPGHSLEEVTQFLRKGPIPADQINALLNKARFDATHNWVEIEPADEEIVALPKEARLYIYKELASYDVNNMNTKTFRYSGSRLEDWMQGAQLSPKLLELLDRLICQNGSLMLMADAALLMKHVTSADEQKQLFRALSREKTMVIKLVLDDDSDIESIAKYWGRGLHTKNIYPLLESLQNRTGDRSIDIIHLLPPFARKHLYMYPTFDNLDVKFRDCHWSANNFFTFGNPTPPLTPEMVQYNFIDNCCQVDKEDLRLGDRIIYVNHNSELIHSAIYVAGDIVFTKNGTSYSTPWMFMTLDDMKYYYFDSHDFSVYYMRPNG